MWAVWWAWLAPCLVGCQALPCEDAAGCCLAGPGHKMAGCGILGASGASAGSLVGRVRVLKSLGLIPNHWQVKPDPGVNVKLLAGRACFWHLNAEPRDPRACFRYLGWEGAVPDTVGYKVQGIPKVAFVC